MLAGLNTDKAIGLDEFNVRVLTCLYLLTLIFDLLFIVAPIVCGGSLFGSCLVI